MKLGDIFKIQMSPNEFAFGRVMLNVETQCKVTKLIKNDSILTALPEVLLVEIYRETSTGELPDSKTLLIPGILLQTWLFEKGGFPLIGFEHVEVKDVEFPESVISEGVKKAALIKGEVRYVFDMDIEKVEAIKIRPKALTPIYLAEIVLYQLGRKDEINNPALKNKEFRNMNRHDLRFSEHRKEVFELAGLDPDESYYELSKRMGFDIERFY